MPNISHKTRAVATRISLEAYTAVKRKADKRGLTVGKYLRRFIEYDALRKR